MMTAKDYFKPEDQEYIIALRREIHEYPEVGFELDRTVAVVKRELDALQIPYTEQFGQCSLVATVNPDCKGPTIGLRADMDALPLTETADVPFKSKLPGAMHACGHDAHTAMLLGAAKALKRMEKDLKCRVKLIFQPNEEGAVSGAEMMVRNGAAEDIDFLLGLHTDNSYETGKLGVYSGEYMAACHPYSIEFFGKAVHATIPQNGHDALAMAVKAYNNIYLMKSRELSPFSHHVLSVSSIQAGEVHNIIANYAKMLISFRFYNMQEHDFIDSRIRMICRHAAEELDGEVKFTDGISCPALINDPAVTQIARMAAVKVVGEENVVEAEQKLSSEDFSHFLQKKPGVLVRVGTRNEAKGCTTSAHNANHIIDEDAFIYGSQIYVQFAMEYGMA